MLFSYGQFDKANTYDFTDYTPANKDLLSGSMAFMVEFLIFSTIP